jgi:hypothetical protein
MNNPLVFQILGALVALGFIFLLVMCWKTWRWAHIFFAFLVFAGAVTFLLFGSMVLKTQNAWRKHFESYTRALEKVEADNHKLLYGDLEEVHQKEPSIRSLLAELNNLQVDRGRLWRECRVLQPVNATTFRVSTVPASQPENTPPTPNGLVAKAVLYAFSELDSPEGWKVPAIYLGQFAVEAAAETEVTISALRPLDAEQAQAIQANSTWALYEILPLDSHETYAQYDETEKRLVGLDKEELRKYMSNRLNWPQDKYEAFLDQFYRFNRDKIDSDPAERLWTLVKFVKPHEIQVDSDVEQSILEEGGRFFDSSGRALEAQVRHGEGGSVKFKPGDTGIFDPDTAETLINDGLATKEKEVYRRPLNDFAYFFRDEPFRHKELDDAIARATRDAAVLAALRAKAEEQLAFHQKEHANLEQDKAGFDKERNDLRAFAQALETNRQAMFQRLSELYRSNVQLVAQMTQLQFQMAQKINERTQRALGIEPTPPPATSSPPAPAATPAATPAAAPPAATPPAATPPPAGAPSAS